MNIKANLINYFLNYLTFSQLSELQLKDILFEGENGFLLNKPLDKKTNRLLHIYINYHNLTSQQDYLFPSNHKNRKHICENRVREIVSKTKMEFVKS